MSKREKHKQKLERKDRIQRLARTLAASFASWSKENSLSGITWDDDREKRVQQGVALWISSTVPSVPLKVATGYARLIVGSTEERVAVNMEKLARMLVEREETA